MIDLFKEFGGDIESLNAVSGLTGLKNSLSFIQSLISQLQAQLPDPIQELLKGNMGADVISALTGAGLNPSNFTGLADIAKVRNEFNAANFQPFQTLTADLSNYLKQYGVKILNCI